MSLFRPFSLTLQTKFILHPISLHYLSVVFTTWLYPHLANWHNWTWFTSTELSHSYKLPQLSVPLREDCKYTGVMCGLEKQDPVFVCNRLLIWIPRYWSKSLTEYSYHWLPLCKAFNPLSTATQLLTIHFLSRSGKGYGKIIIPNQELSTHHCYMEEVWNSKDSSFLGQIGYSGID